MCSSDLCCFECSVVLPSRLVVFSDESRAHDVAQSKQHKSISASDVLKALELLEFGDLVEPLQSELLGEVIYYTVPQPGAHAFYSRSSVSRAGEDR